MEMYKCVGSPSDAVLWLHGINVDQLWHAKGKEPFQESFQFSNINKKTPCSEWQGVLFQSVQEGTKFFSQNQQLSQGMKLAGLVELESVLLQQGHQGPLIWCRNCLTGEVFRRVAGKPWVGSVWFTTAWSTWQIKATDTSSTVLGNWYSPMIR